MMAGGGGLPYLGMVGRFCGIDPQFFLKRYFDPNGSLCYASSQSDWPPISAEKIGLSLSYLVSELLRPKVGLIVPQNLFFNSF